MEKLYGELIECIIRAYRVNRYDNFPVNFFFLIMCYSVRRYATHFMNSKLGLIFSLKQHKYNTQAINWLTSDDKLALSR